MDKVEPEIPSPGFMAEPYPTPISVSHGFSEVESDFVTRETRWNDESRHEVDSLPDDLFLECLSWVPPPSLLSVSLVYRRWSRLFESPAFSGLR
ncbi:hypothetical protein CDL15_Pgr009449 [Punica granatum]|uniref:F-box domain-containing protein n=1 Tax=Punica granatum TaxID=22663 RepID=A0A218WSN9_PUNGR|nr:hypothetical protein CDL15_Pgr009449 [Punica granatum]PKI60509.1 hypothetical protein CRG98_019163 [Punica granatum]